MIGWFLFAFLALVAISILRAASVSEVRPPAGLGAGSVPAAGPEGETSFSGRVRGVAWAAESFDGETLTVEVAPAAPVAAPLEVNAREGEPTVPPVPYADEVRALLDLGASYVDVGFNADRIAAELDPAAPVAFDRRRVERAADHLVRIREILSRG